MKNNLTLKQEQQIFLKHEINFDTNTYLLGFDNMQYFDPQREALQKVFDITKEDLINIELADVVGVTHLAVSYPEVQKRNSCILLNNFAMTKSLRALIAHLQRHQILKLTKNA